MNQEAVAAPGVVLVVDDAPGNLAVLYEMLRGCGYEVRVTTNGEAALESARLSPPDLVLLDAMMPGIDGFETCRRLKARLETQAIPVIFMTGLSDTDHVVQGFQAGGVDYVTKPIQLPEVLARVATHLRNARLVAETHQAADAAGDAIVGLDADGRVRWMTPLAQSWLQTALEPDGTPPAALRRWLHDSQARGGSFNLALLGHRLSFSRLRAAAGGGALLLVQRNEPVPDPLSLMQALRLTSREAEVLYWVAIGKTNPEIATVLDMSPRTVNKHLEHVYAKLNVETRTAAATVAQTRGRLTV